MNVGILGGGFGLYGYIPAFLELGMEVSTLRKYKHEIDERPELKDFSKRIRFLSTEDEVISSSGVMTVARTPSSQAKFIEGIHSNFTHLFLEKPLADSVKQHEKSLNRLVDLKQNFSIAYLFSYCAWWPIARDILISEKAASVVIHWAVPMSSTNWKGNLFDGGGLGSYYGIHLIPLIKDLDFNAEIHYSSEGAIDATVGIVASNKIGSSLYVKIYRAEKPKFVVFEDLGFSKNVFFEAESPFGEAGRSGIADSRVPFLMKYISDKLVSSSLMSEYALEVEILRFRRQIVIEA